MKRIRAGILFFDLVMGLLLFLFGTGRLAGDAAEAVGKRAQGEYRQETGAGAPKIGGNGEHDIQADSTAPKKIALTFDDGPHPQYTEQLLDGLKERGVHVTFFVTGEHAALHPDIIERMQADA